MPTMFNIVLNIKIYKKEIHHILKKFTKLVRKMTQAKFSNKRRSILDIT